MLWRDASSYPFCSPSSLIPRAGADAPQSAAGNVGAKLTGVVYYSGDVMHRFPVILYSSDQVVQTETDKAGHFEFADLPHGTYDIQAKYWNVEGTIYDVRIGDQDVGPVTLTVKPVGFFYPLDHDCGRTFRASYKPDSIAGGRMVGTLETYPDMPKNLLPSFTVNLTAVDHQRVSQRPDTNGGFLFQNVVPGRYSLVAGRRGYWKVQSTVWIARKDTTVVKIILVKHGHPIICE